jgi:hypothetical protein
MELVIFTLFFCSSAECSSPVTAAPRGRRQWSRDRPGHHDHVRATKDTPNGPTSSKVRRRECYLASADMKLAMRRRGQRPRLYDQVPATHKERCRGQRPGHHDHAHATESSRTGNGLESAFPKMHRRVCCLTALRKRLVMYTLLLCSSTECPSPDATAPRRIAAINGLSTGLSTTIKYVRRTASCAAGNGLGTTAKYLRRTRNGAVGYGLGTATMHLSQCPYVLTIIIFY